MSRLIAIFIVLLSPVVVRPATSCDPIVTFADGKTPLREIFVSTSGNNSTGDGSQSKPFQSLNRALQGVRSGDAIRLLPGQYSPGTSIANVSGTESAPIWIGGLPDSERPAIRGGSAGLLLNRVRYLILENLEVSGATGNGINCDDGGDYGNSNATRHVVFRNLNIHDIGTGGNSDGLKLSGVNAFFVQDCEFARISAGGSAIDHVGCHQGLIARSTFTDCGNAVQCKGGSEDIEVRWSRFLRAGGRAINIGGSTGLTLFRPPLSRTSPNSESKNIRVIANTFEGSDAPVAFVGTVNSLVANNTIVNPTRWVARILQETVSGNGYIFLPCSSNEFSNNLIWYSRATVNTHVNVGANTDAASFTFSNNLWYAHDQPARSQPTLPVREANGVIGQDPKFQNVANRDYSVATNSPAAGKGKGFDIVKADVMERCFTKPPTIGAFEANPPATPRADSDRDGMFDDSELVAGTNPYDPDSILKIQSVRITPESHVIIQYLTSTGRVYRVESRPISMSNAIWDFGTSQIGTGEAIQFRSAADPLGKLYRVTVSTAQ